MGRNIRHALPADAPATPEAAEVAPHRYLYNHEGDEMDFRFKWAELGYKEWRAAVPYKAGEVIYFQSNGEATKALILDVGSYRPEAGIYAGDKVETYRIAYATKTGKWSKNWLRIYPGDVQRGYKLAGLAPDVP